MWKEENANKTNEDNIRKEKENNFAHNPLFFTLPKSVLLLLSPKSWNYWMRDKLLIIELFLFFIFFPSVVPILVQSKSYILDMWFSYILNNLTLNENEL